ncbi:MAG: alcohol dehydrogenase catalytic domain-containing protein [Acidobacteria bacterium]|nr:alcohol dehydrogenase catalytic domain-containing protein [Acidobacteriota bacterium]
MKVAGYRIHEWGGPLRWESFDVAAPQPAEVLVRVEACGIGLTVLNCIRGDLANEAARLPRVPGHEIVGRVEAVGESVTAPAIGQRVMAYFYLVCGRCEACRSGGDSLCRNLAGWVGVHRDGGYAPVTVLPAANVVPLPDSIPAAQATAIPDAIATPLHVCRTRARVQPGDRVAVIGAGGGIGIHMVEMAALFGARVAGLEAGEGKLETIRRMGAVPILSRSFDEIDLSPAFDDERPTVVVDLVGSRASLAWALDALALGGRLVVLTTFRDVGLPVTPRDLVLREITLYGSRYASKAELRESAELVAAGRIHPVVSRVVPPTGIEQVHRALREGTLIGRGAVNWTL